MRQRGEVSETGWALAKAGVLIVVLITLAGFTVFSHAYSHARAGRISCFDNQRATSIALLDYQADNAGSSPPTLDVLEAAEPRRGQVLGRCPADTSLRYTYDDDSGAMVCPNPEHRSRATIGPAAVQVGGPR